MPNSKSDSDALRNFAFIGHQKENRRKTSILELIRARVGKGPTVRRPTAAGRCFYQRSRRLRRRRHRTDDHQSRRLHEDLNDVHLKQPLKRTAERWRARLPRRQPGLERLREQQPLVHHEPVLGPAKSTLHCASCGNQSVRYEVFSHLSVPVFHFLEFWVQNHT